MFLFDLVEFRPPFLLLQPQNVHIYFTGPRRARGVPGWNRIGARVSPIKCYRDTHKTECGSLIFFVLVLFGRRLWLSPHCRNYILPWSWSKINSINNVPVIVLSFCEYTERLPPTNSFRNPGVLYKDAIIEKHTWKEDLSGQNTHSWRFNKSGKCSFVSCWDSDPLQSVMGFPLARVPPFHRLF